MLPVLFSIGKVSVSSFGVFLAFGFLLATFLVWRLSRAWELDEEKTLDLTLLTFIGGLVGARLYFVVENWQYFAGSLVNIILVNKIPGFAFWGGFLGGWLALYFFSKRIKIDFWQAADIALVGLLAGLTLASMGCFLGGCNVGAPTKNFLAVTMIGFVGTRWPVQLFESALLGLALVKIWSEATHFHLRGKIVSLGFIYIGLINLLLTPIKQDQSGKGFALILIFLGIFIYYMITKQSPITHLKVLILFVVKFATDSKARTLVMQKISKYWYNQKTSLEWKLKNFKKLLRRSNVKFS